MSSKRIADGACIQLDRSSVAPVLATVLFLFLATMVVGSASAAEDECFLVPLDRVTTGTTDGPAALADITICYRPLPEEFWSTEPVLRAQAGATSVNPPATVSDPGIGSVPSEKPDRT